MIETVMRVLLKDSLPVVIPASTGETNQKWCDEAGGQ
jgi:hypothetical protein